MIPTAGLVCIVASPWYSAVLVIPIRIRRALEIPIR